MITDFSYLVLTVRRVLKKSKSSYSMLTNRAFYFSSFYILVPIEVWGNKNRFFL